jgi:uncharacterized protein with HEPN domain
MPPSVDDRLKDIAESIAEIQKLLVGVDFQTFSMDRMLSLAAERLLEIVCEASRTLPDEIKTNAPGIDWRKMIDFGNLLRHAYHTTNANIVWDVIQNHLPPLKSFVERRIGASNR